MDDQAVRYRRLVSKGTTPTSPPPATGAATSDR